MASSARKPCACGCERTTTRTVAKGHDLRLLHMVARNDPAELAGVRWWRIPEGFHEDALGEHIKWHLTYQERLREIKNRDAGQGTTNAETD